MMNPIALFLLLVGVVLFGMGLRFVRQYRKTAGLTLIVAGLVVAAAPLISTFFLFR
jgi:hypothetical protein